MSERTSQSKQNPRASNKMEALMNAAQAKSMDRIQAIQDRLAEARHQELHNTEQLTTELMQVATAMNDLTQEIALQTKALGSAAEETHRSLSEMNSTRRKIEAAGHEIERIIALQLNQPTTKRMITIALMSAGITALIMAALLIGPLIWLQRLGGV